MKTAKESSSHVQTLENAQAAKQAFKRLAKSVCVLSCFDDGNRYASVATAVSNVSNEPPSLLVCLEKSASFGKLLDIGKHFTVNVLGADQQSIVDNCMQQKGEQRFSVGNWEETGEQLPYLAGAQANFFCHVAEIRSFETHHIVFAHIESAQCSEQASALIYAGGKFIAIDSLSA